ncbi:MAG: PhnD/SsuA/transferrin family substrate-binding protein [Candidatus Thiodiazotropha lotti]|uniref:PhnD/SsuA/transferrin family substrate-binding protein n=1 Tax=Candidatus Thiodiazotropha endoloripes TaxID=1818881 RepID=UPI0009F73F6F|nr:PhnD/SsuA/transferrin family substrate-binding protein [Candidatus Thiodiazotropha endoloripes]MCG7992794.1 PhnD/SsuA/transferrin family substrate-binding protein [Candidatus Thiodiazotropha lotti]MCG7998859.1 PhnD/SsuA/transferrin family substrate-binding protein [Candidatus Thiodiazotropha lotti]MCW4184455.1 PhnD/SsuA/transferrin family substrate-binding protein [Candidatus Thiodiazotropha weberae]MCW4190626.1 PhnD/SsuA/transferrin family substrate-binding protein [Candidatus Thiodiazotrop
MVNSGESLRWWGVAGLLLLQFLFPSLLYADMVRIGVLSHRGDQATLRNWGPTAEYLHSSIPAHDFIIRPLKFDDVNPAVSAGEVDFVLVNPGIYVNLEVKYRVSRIATLYNRRNDVPYKIFGGVIFTRQDHAEINTLADLRGHTMMAVYDTSLGGFQMAMREMVDQGIDPYTDLKALRWGGIHDHVVMAVLNGEVDVGTVRTDILERMASVGTIELKDFRIINPQQVEEFPFALSTRLYPEWPFSKVAHTADTLAQQVAVALLNMPHDHHAALAGKYAGWTIPLDYQPVHDLFMTLKLPPYQYLGKITLVDAISRYRYWLLGGLLMLLFMVVMTLKVMRLNQELKKAKDRLELQHELILDSVADGIYGVDMNGRSTFFNKAAERITGWEAEDVIGHNQHEILHHSHEDGSPHRAVDCPVYQTFRDDQPRYISDDVFWRKDSTSFPVEYSSTPIKDEGGKTIGSVVVFRDITMRKRAEEEARQHQLELARAGRLSTLGEMASGIAHELNQPLTAISTNAQASMRILESDPSNTTVCVDVMERIAAQADRAGEIIRQLRRFVRKEPLESSLVDVNVLVNAVAVLIRPDITRADVRLILDMEQPLPTVLVQPIQIEQVILNLARNAIEALSELDDQERVLHIGTRQQPGGIIHLWVRDNGPGIKPELETTLFDPFVTGKSDGMGLGLSISYGIIEAHGGKLSINPDYRDGAEFSFNLPIGEVA